MEDIALACIVKAFLEPAAYIYEDDDVGVLKIIMNQTGVTPTTENRQVSSAKGYVERVVPSLSSIEFKSHFRMLPSTFEFVLCEIGAKLTRTAEGRPMIPADKQLLLSLWRFATSDSYSLIVERFHVGKGTAIRAVERVATALCELSSKYIIWPTGNKVQTVVHGFSRVSDFPDTIGAIDDTYINVHTHKNAEAYVNKKSRHSIHLQAICDHTGQFTYIYIGNMHSIHNNHVSHLSALQEYINDSNKFPNNTHLIGDATYKLHQHLMVPYSVNRPLTKQQKNYNFCHSSSRMIIEKAFALLKGRWKSLLNILAINRMYFTSYHILACCVLHNICLINRDELQLEGQVIVLGAEEIRKRRVEYNYDGTIAEVKRNNICAKLCSRNA